MFEHKKKKEKRLVFEPCAQTMKMKIYLNEHRIQQKLFTSFRKIEFKCVIPICFSMFLDLLFQLFLCCSHSFLFRFSVYFRILYFQLFFVYIRYFSRVSLNRKKKKQTKIWLLYVSNDVVSRDWKWIYFSFSF